MLQTLKITVLFILLTNIQAKAQVSFSPFREIDTVQYESYRNQYMQDIDLDGDLDLLDQINNGAMVVWYEHDANNNVFTRHTVLSLTGGEIASEIFPVDMDLDGDIDVMAMQLSGTTARFVWYENNGTGIFSNNHVVAIVSGIFAKYDLMKMADLNQDGKFDIIVSAYSGNNYVYWLKNIGDNLQFETAVPILTPANIIIDFSLVDMNMDGKIDILYSCSNSNGSFMTLQYAQKTNTGYYSDEVSISQTLFWSNYTVTDLNLDGIPDVIVFNEKPNAFLAWIKNNGNDSFVVNSIDTFDSEFISFYSDDFDGDGDNDIIGTYFDSNFIYNFNVYINNGQENFTKTQSKKLDYIDILSGFFINKWDGDSNKDLVITDNNFVYFLKSDESQNFSQEKKISLSKPLISNASAIDLNHDGLQDIVGLRGDESTMYKNVGNQYFSEKIKLIPDAPAAQNIFNDVDNDQLIDLIQVSDSTLKWFKNIGSAQFEYKQTIITQQYITLVRTSDFDNDNDQDIILLKYKPTISNIGSLYVLKNNGLGEFESFLVDSLGVPNIHDLVVADLNGDSYPDICYQYGNKLYWSKNDHSGHFGKGKYIGNINSSSDLMAVDTDNDGDLDMFLINNNGKAFITFKNDGMGNFGSSQNQAFPDQAFTINSFPMTDLDMDGDVDLVAGSMANGIRWFINDGNGQFSEGGTLLQTGHWNIELSDLDNDGDKDVIGVEELLHTIVWFENNTTVPTQNPNSQITNITLSPNPSDSQVAITIKADNSDRKYNINVQDICGNTLKKIQNIRSSTKVTRDGAEPGIYIITIFDAEKGNLVGTKKLIWK
ncbi:VCBS repeat-containing protein [Runella sp.]|uniref:FG-GAP repeat domain-containing protein n=1 Tax=Runella sp. TaxID=1960881 RepID=UPI0030180D96